MTVASSRSGVLFLLTALSVPAANSGGALPHSPAEDVDKAPEAAECNPVSVVPAPSGMVLHEIALSADGASILAFGRLREANLWAVGAYWAPEILCGPLLLAGGLLLRRSTRRRTLVGELHCRRCLYLLRGLEGDSKCPECGLDLTPANRLVGRDQRRRIVFSASLVVAAVAVYPALLLIGAREGAFANWINLHSSSAYVWLENTAWDRPPFVRESYRVVMLDANTGILRRTVCDLSKDESLLLPSPLPFRSSDGPWHVPDPAPGVFALAVAPDGESFVIVGHTSIQLRRLSDGVIMRAIAPVSPLPQFVEFRAEGTVLSAWWPPVVGRRLTEWDVTSGMPVAPCERSPKSEAVGVDSAVRAGTGGILIPLWSPGGRRSGETLCVLRGGPEGTSGWAGVSYDGRRVAYLDGYDHWRRQAIYVYDTTEYRHQLRGN